MQARVRTVAFQGIDVLPVDVQVLVAPGNIAFAMVGLADKAVGESRERVRATFRALGLSLPPQRITVNLSPADLAKEGSHYDLPIALGLLAAMGVVAARKHRGLRRAGRAGARRLAQPRSRRAAGGDRRPRGGARRDLPRGVRRRGRVGWLRRSQTTADRPPIIAAPSLLALINHLRGQQTLAGARGAGRRGSRAAIPTLPRSRARRAPSACSKWRRRAATTS